MSAYRTWDPFREMFALHETMNQLLQNGFGDPGAARGGTATYTFPLNIHGTAEELRVEALLPGVSQEDVQIDIDRGVLTVAAKRHGPDTGEGARWHLREFNGGQFARSVSLPFPVDVARASADFGNGVLTLTLPKAEAAKPKRIPLGAGQHQEQLGAGEGHREHDSVIEGKVEENQPNDTAKHRRAKRNG